MAVEDSAVLSEIFAHLNRPDQITSFLYAFQDLRQKRVAAVLEEEIHNIEVMAMPPGEQQQVGGFSVSNTGVGLWGCCRRETRRCARSAMRARTRSMCMRGRRSIPRSIKRRRRYTRMRRRKRLRTGMFSFMQCV